MQTVNLPVKTMNSSQKKFLREQLSEIKNANYRARWDAEEKKDEPITVQAARKLIKKFEAQHREAQAARRKKFETVSAPAYAKVEKAILFGTSDEALAAVEAARALKF
jgi:hypothetical protein